MGNTILIPRQLQSLLTVRDDIFFEYSTDETNPATGGSFFQHPKHRVAELWKAASAVQQDIAAHLTQVAQSPERASWTNLHELLIATQAASAKGCTPHDIMGDASESKDADAKVIADFMAEKAELTVPEILDLAHVPRSAFLAVYISLMKMFLSLQGGNDRYRDPDDIKSDIYGDELCAYERVVLMYTAAWMCVLASVLEVRRETLSSGGIHIRVCFTDAPKNETDAAQSLFLQDFVTTIRTSAGLEVPWYPPPPPPHAAESADPWLPPLERPASDVDSDSKACPYCNRSYTRADLVRLKNLPDVDGWLPKEQAAYLHLQLCPPADMTGMMAAFMAELAATHEHAEALAKARHEEQEANAKARHEEEMRKLEELKAQGATTQQKVEEVKEQVKELAATVTKTQVLPSILKEAWQLMGPTLILAGKDPGALAMNIAVGIASPTANYKIIAMVACMPMTATYCSCFGLDDYANFKDPRNDYHELVATYTAAKAAEDHGSGSLLSRSIGSVVLYLLSGTAHVVLYTSLRNRLMRALWSNTAYRASLKLLPNGLIRIFNPGQMAISLAVTVLNTLRDSEYHAMVTGDWKGKRSVVVSIAKMILYVISSPRLIENVAQANIAAGVTSEIIAVVTSAMNASGFADLCLRTGIGIIDLITFERGAWFAAQTCLMLYSARLHRTLAGKLTNRADSGPYAILGKIAANLTLQAILTNAEFVLLKFLSWLHIGAVSVTIWNKLSDLWNNETLWNGLKFFSSRVGEALSWTKARLAKHHADLGFTVGAKEATEVAGATALDTAVKYGGTAYRVLKDIHDAFAMVIDPMPYLNNMIWGMPAAPTTQTPPSQTIPDIPAAAAPDPEEAIEDAFTDIQDLINRWSYSINGVIDQLASAVGDSDEATQLFFIGTLREARDRMPWTGLGTPMPESPTPVTLDDVQNYLADIRLQWAPHRIECSYRKGITRIVNYTRLAGTIVVKETVRQLMGLVDDSVAAGMLAGPDTPTTTAATTAVASTEAPTSIAFYAGVVAAGALIIGSIAAVAAHVRRKRHKEKHGKEPEQTVQETLPPPTPRDVESQRFASMGTVVRRFKSLESV